MIEAINAASGRKSMPWICRAASMERAERFRAVAVKASENHNLLSPQGRPSPAAGPSALRGKVHVADIGDRRGRARQRIKPQTFLNRPRALERKAFPMPRVECTQICSKVTRWWCPAGGIHRPGRRDLRHAARCARAPGSSPLLRHARGARRQRGRQASPSWSAQSMVPPSWTAFLSRSPAEMWWCLDQAAGSAARCRGNVLSPPWRWELRGRARRGCIEPASAERARGDCWGGHKDASGRGYLC